jgi:hypothetical protein
MIPCIQVLHSFLSSISLRSLLDQIQVNWPFVGKLNYKFISVLVKFKQGGGYECGVTESFAKQFQMPDRT